MNTDLGTANALFELFTKATRDIVWNWDFETDTIWWSEGYTVVFGHKIPAPESNPDSWYTYLHPDDKDRVLDSLHKAIDQGDISWAEEYRFRRADDSYAIVYDRGYIVHQDGKAVRMVGTMQDITEGIVLKQERDESEQRLEFALQSAQLGTWNLDPMEKMVHWDDRSRSLFGLFRIEKLTYDQVMNYIHPDDKLRVHEAIQWALNPESGGSYDMSFRTIGVDDAKHRWVRFIGQAYYSETGQAYRFSGVSQDITAEVLAREKTAISEQQSRLALEGSGSGSFSIDLQTNEIVYSPALARILTGEVHLGLARNVFVNHLHPDDRQVRDKAYREALHSGALNYEARFIWKNKEVHWVKVLGQYFYDTSRKPISFSGIVLDITQQKEKDNALKRAEERFRNMVNQSPAAISILSGPALVVETVNTPMLELWGKGTEIIGLPISKALPEIQGQGFIELLKNVYDTGVSHYGFEQLARLYRKGQLENAYFNFVYAPIRADNENITDVVVLATEVTAQVEIKLALAESEQRFRNLIEEAPAAICLFTGPDMIIEMPNEAMLKFWGKGDTVIGKPLRQALPELIDQPFLQILDEVYRTGIEYTSQEAKAVLVSDGKPITYYFNFTYKPLRNADGEVYAILDVAIDITEQVLARRKVEASELQFRTLLEAISPMTWTSTPDGEVNFYNQQWYTYTGLTCEPTKPLSWQEIIHPDDLPYTMEAYTKALTTGEIFVVENRYRRGSDGMYRWHLNRAFPILEETGAITLWVGTATDIHEQKRIEADLEKQVQARTRELNESNQDLIRSNENLTRFAYVASHDLQEPLRKIQSFGSLLQSQYAASLGESGLDLINRMQLSAGRMSELIRDLLAYSRISTRQQIFDPVSLTEIVLKVREALELQIHQSRTTFQIDDLPTINGDSSQLGQLFQNLLSNAMKFSHPDTAPLIQIRYNKLSAADLPKDVKPTRHTKYYHQLSVIDNGIGFDQKYASRIFEVFQRLHGRSTYSGTGVGLAICQKVVENHGGTITAHGQPGQGSIFTVYLTA